MSQTSPVIGLPYIQPAQAQKHVTHNEALRILDAITQLSVLSAAQSSPPAEPSEGDCYIVAPAGTDAWAGQDSAIAVRVDETWQFFAPRPGWRADVIPTGETLRFDGTEWSTAGGSGANAVSTLGVNAAADEINRLVVSAPATLLNHEGAGHQLKINKSTSGNTASLLFQTGFSGRAEMGTAGSDDFAIKVSPDGASFLTALSVEASTGRVSFPAMPDVMRTRLTGSRSYYVSLAGSDTNDGRSPGTAFRSLQTAIDTLLSLDCGSHDVTIVVSPGDYDEIAIVSGPVLGTGSYRIEGDSTTPSNVRTRRIVLEAGARLEIDGLELTAPSGTLTQGGGHLTASNLRFTGAGSAFLIRSGRVDCIGPVSIGPAVKMIADMTDFAHLTTTASTFTLEPGIDWGTGNTGAIVARRHSLARLAEANFSGTATGARYYAASNSTIDTEGAGETFLPGNAPGTSATQAQYL